MKLGQKRLLKRRLAPALGLALAFAACGGATGTSSGSETHWLRECDADSECGALECLCGVCTLRCEENSDCAEAPGEASCATSANDLLSALCGSSEPSAGVCVSECEGDGDCGERQRCESGVCRPQAASKAPDGASCDTHEDCQSGICEGMGCGANEGICAEADRACSEDEVDYCGCDGETFSGSSSCPGARYATVGACEDDLPIPEGCEFLRETEPAPACDSEATCEQVQSETQPRLYDLELRESTTDAAGDDVAFSDEELDARLDCLVRWLEALGLEPNALESLHNVLVDATYEEIAPVLESAVIDTYWIDCAGGDCTYCQALDEADCNEDAFCAPYAGQPVDEARQCLEARTFMVCVGANDGFDDASAYQRDASGQCWFTNTQAQNLLEFTFDSSCTGSEPSDSPLPDCE